MKAAIAKVPDAGSLEDLGRATLRIIHDLKNQLNGLKLYATFLRKRLERQDRSPQEQETVEKLIAGLDRAARYLTALVRYAQPLELRRQPQTDLRRIILGAASDSVNRATGPLTEPLKCDLEAASFVGAFDSDVLAEAFRALTHEAVSSAASKGPHTLSLHVRRVAAATSPLAVIEWRGLRRRAQMPTSDSFGNQQSVYAAFAARAIAAHGGRLEFDADTIRVSLPLSK